MINFCGCSLCAWKWYVVSCTWYSPLCIVTQSGWLRALRNSSIPLLISGWFLGFWERDVQALTVIMNLPILLCRTIVFALYIPLCGTPASQLVGCPWPCGQPPIPAPQCLLLRWWNRFAISCIQGQNFSCTFCILLLSGFLYVFQCPEKSFLVLSIKCVKSEKGGRKG